MKKSFPRLLLFSSALLSGQVAFAAAFQLYELGTPIVGTAGVGQASNTGDASTSYFNPAGMSGLSQTQFMLGSQMILTKMDFSTHSNTTIPGNNGSNAGGLIPGFGGYYVYNFSPKFKMGVSLTSPYGGAENYNNHWVGRYNVQQMTFYTMDLNPALSYQVNQWLALGAGATVEYANLYQTVALPISPTVDGQLTLKFNDTAPGFNLGALVTPNQATTIGLAFRSQIVHHLSGNVDFMNLSARPSARTSMVMPANVIASITEAVSPKWVLLGELGWSNWSSMVNNVTYVDGYTATTPQNWHDTYRVGLGTRYKVWPALSLQVGASYDSSPTTTAKRLPVLPMDRQVRLGAGLEYIVIPAVTLGVSYEHINFGSAHIDNTGSFGTLAGAYSRNYANVLQASVNVACG